MIQNIRGYFAVPALLLFDFLAKLKFTKQRKSKVLIVRVDAVGDFFIWLSTAKFYRRLYNNEEITLLANSTWAEYAKNFSYWDSVWSVDVEKFSKNLIYRIKTIKKIRNANFMRAIQPTYSRALLHGDSLIWASSATERIGSIGNTNNLRSLEKTIGDMFYTQLLPASPAPLMELDRNAEFVRALGRNEYFCDLENVPINTTAPTAFTSEGDYFVVVPGASWSGKRWATQSFAEVANNLALTSGWRLVVCGLPDEWQLGEEIIAISGLKSATNLIGKTTLAELVEIVRNAKIIIGNDTSAIHIAAAVRTPSVCILGGGHYGRFLPYPTKLPGIKPFVVIHEMTCFYCNWVCTQPHQIGDPVPCISSITPERVIDFVNLALIAGKKIDCD